MTATHKFELIASLAFLVCSAAHAQDTNRPLNAQPREDSLAIAEQLYAQARTQTNDPEQKKADLLKAADLFARYQTKYPKAQDKDKALYLQASCLEEAGDLAAANERLGALANNMHGEYAAAAAYKLGTQASDRGIWDKAIGYFRIVSRESKRPALLQDALYRQGRVLIQQGKRREAETVLRRLLETKGTQPALLQAALLALAQMKTEEGQDAEAFGLFTRLLGMQGLEKAVRGLATLQAARLATKLGRDQDAQTLYDQVSQIDELAQYTAEAQLEALVRLYKRKDYENIFKKVSQNYHPLNDPEKEAKRALIVGQAYMEMERYEQAAQWFEMAEKYQPGGLLGADAAYRRIVCAQHLREINILSLAQRFLNMYATSGSPAEGQPVCDWVRFTYADRIMPTDPDQAARQFDAIRIEQLPASMRADAEYKKAWSAAQGDTYDPIPTLNHFIATYKQDPRLPEAYTLRGATYAKQGKLGEALHDFDYVIANFPGSDAVPVCWQKAAQASTSDPQRMIRYYEGLIACRGRVKPAALAEAHYSIACALYETRPQNAIPHFQDAATINPEQYSSRVDTALVQCYFKLQDAENLQKALKKLQEANPASYNALPPGILRWCGWMCYQKKNYGAADKFLSDALAREPKENYTAMDGSRKERPQAEPLVWKVLARARLELQQYPRGLEAARHYVSMETQPYRKAEGMRDLAQILLGLGKPGEARKVCEDAIALGIDGPIKSALFITLGDTYFAQGNCNEAAKFYGRVANVVSDAELKPLSTYKLIAALERAGKNVEAEQYKTVLKNDYPGWIPPAEATRLIKAAPATSK